MNLFSLPYTSSSPCWEHCSRDAKGSTPGQDRPTTRVHSESLMCWPQGPKSQLLTACCLNTGSSYHPQSSNQSLMTYTQHMLVLWRWKAWLTSSFSGQVLMQTSSTLASHALSVPSTHMLHPSSATIIASTPKAPWNAWTLNSFPFPLLGSVLDVL